MQETQKPKGLKKIWREIKRPFRTLKNAITGDLVSKVDLSHSTAALKADLAQIERRLLDVGKSMPEKEVIRGVREKHALIIDYTYTPKHRTSLKESKIGEILESWYANNQGEVVELVRKFCSFRELYENIPIDPMDTTPLSSPRWNNGWVSPLDAISIYGFLAIHNPRYYVEVGSGNSTMFAARSIRDHHLRTKIISIDPHPRAEINELCHKIYRMPFEDMDINFFTTLTAEDILLVDNSHRSFPNSDVTVFFTEVLPKLPAGLLYTLHDIYLPCDYPARWSCKQRRWYNEQYLLCAYLLGGADSEIVHPNAFLATNSEILSLYYGMGDKMDEVLERVWVKMWDSRTSFFWLRKG